MIWFIFCGPVHHFEFKKIKFLCKIFILTNFIGLFFIHLPISIRPSMKHVLNHELLGLDETGRFLLHDCLYSLDGTEQVISCSLVFYTPWMGRNRSFPAPWYSILLGRDGTGHFLLPGILYSVVFPKFNLLFTVYI